MQQLFYEKSRMLDEYCATAQAGRKLLIRARDGVRCLPPILEWLRSLVQVRTYHHDVDDVDRPGRCEGDTVAHCGATIAGEFLWALTTTDRNEGGRNAPVSGASSPSG